MLWFALRNGAQAKEDRRDMMESVVENDELFCDYFAQWVKV